MRSWQNVCIKIILSKIVLSKNVQLRKNVWTSQYIQHDLSSKYL